MTREKLRNPNLIGVSGKIGAGKDAFWNLWNNLELEAWARQNPLLELRGPFPAQKALQGKPWEVLVPNYYSNKKFANGLKEVAGLILGIHPKDFEDPDFKKQNLDGIWDEHDRFGDRKPMTVREFLQKLGTDAIRNGLHRNTWVNYLVKDWSPELRWIITDVRFLNEANMVKDLGGFMIRINGHSGANDDHPSETQLDRYPDFDFVIENTGSPDEYQEKIREVRSAILSKDSVRNMLL